ncbi:hypothetical protein SAMN04487911_10656 [Arenibacter nanhaiticus]|uniref:Uncharacterized protein n=1 Tax=Arenibacter nanhaiticus TaxID=558155 RepID=A0A1M6E7F1_9FLAO|nr:hypothetical protein [Arenibacter nanhaiticus]SHI81454.1 hypothetical protein SAMN04487911_10656 [Arenibacter nanhaiticus]
MLKIILIVIAMIVEQLSAGQLKNTSGTDIDAKSECSFLNITTLEEEWTLDCLSFGDRGANSCYDHTPLTILVFANFKPESHVALKDEQNKKY